MAMQLAQEVVINASVDLDQTSLEAFDVASSKNPSLTNGALLQACSKKRKHSGVEAENSVFELRIPHNHLRSPISLKIASLEALETLLTIVSSFNSLLSKFSFLSTLLKT